MNLEGAQKLLECNTQLERRVMAAKHMPAELSVYARRRFIELGQRITQAVDTHERLEKNHRFVGANHSGTRELEGGLSVTLSTQTVKAINDRRSPERFTNIGAVWTNNMSPEAPLATEELSLEEVADSVMPEVVYMLMRIDESVSAFTAGKPQA